MSLRDSELNYQLLSYLTAVISEAEEVLSKAVGDMQVLHDLFETSTCMEPISLPMVESAGLSTFAGWSSASLCPHCDDLTTVTTLRS